MQKEHKYKQAGLSSAKAGVELVLQFELELNEVNAW